MQKLIFCALAIVALSATGCHHKLWHKKHANCDCASCECSECKGGCGEGCNEGCGCESCGEGGHKHAGLHHHPHVKHFGGNDGHRYGGYAAEVGPQGPPTGAVAYPYYTTRGPRDFFANNPPSIGP